MSIWLKKFTLETLHKLSQSTMLEHLDIKFVEVGPSSLTATMPVDKRTKQPYGILHGGATAVLAETVGSIASYLTLEGDEKVPVGLDINVSHLKSVSGGYIRATALPIRLGSNIHVWEIRIVNDAGELTAFSRLTMMVIDRNQKLQLNKKD